MSIASVKGRFDLKGTAVVVGLILLTLSVFWQVHGFGFIKFDDPSYVTANPHVLQGFTKASLKWAFVGVHSSNWHPLTSLSHMLDVELFGLRPGIHHSINLLIHIVNVILLFGVLRKMTGSLWCSALVAALFAIHPLRVESVAWISERKDVLSGLFWMLSLLAYWCFVRKRTAANHILLLAMFSLGLMSKPMVVTLPFVLLLLDFWPLHRLSFSGFRVEAAEFVSAGDKKLQACSVAAVFLEKLPMLALSVAASLMTVHAQGQAVVTVEGLPIQIRFFNVALSYIRYLKRTVWPANLAVFYPFHRAFILDQILACSLLLAAVTITAILLRKDLPYILTGWLWYLVSLLPVIGIVQVGSQSGADRYTYLPTIGIYLIFAWGLKDLVKRHSLLRIPAAAFVIVLLATFSVMAARYTSVWQSDDMLLRHALAVTKDNASAHCTLGTQLVQEGRYEEAVTEFRAALSGSSELLGGQNYSEAHAGLGLALFALGRADEAESSFRRSTELTPYIAITHDYLGIALESQGKWQDSLTEFQKAASLGPDEPVTHTNLGLAYLKRGRIDQAISEYREALRLYPDHLDALKGLAWLLATETREDKRNPAEALRYATRATELTHFQDPSALQSLAAAQADNGDYPSALAAAEKALNILKQQGARRDRSLEDKLNMAAELYRSGFAYRR